MDNHDLGRGLGMGALTGGVAATVGQGISHSYIKEHSVKYENYSGAGKHHTPGRSSTINVYLCCAVLIVLCSLVAFWWAGCKNSCAVAVIPLFFVFVFAWKLRTYTVIYNNDIPNVKKSIEWEKEGRTTDTTGVIKNMKVEVKP